VGFLVAIFPNLLVDAGRILKIAFAFRWAAGGLLSLADIRSALGGLGASDELIPIVEKLKGKLQGETFNFIRQKLEKGEPPSAQDVEEFIRQQNEQVAPSLEPEESAAIEGHPAAGWLRTALLKTKRAGETQLYNALLALPKNHYFQEWSEEARMDPGSVMPEELLREMEFRATPLGEMSETAIKTLEQTVPSARLRHFLSQFATSWDRPEEMEDYLPEVVRHYGRGVGFLHNVTYGDLRNEGLRDRRMACRALKDKPYKPQDPALISYGPDWKDPDFQGHTVVEITDPYDFMVESGKMGHCVGDDPSYTGRVNRKETRIFSLRDAGDSPLVTIELSPDLSELDSAMGVDNDEPDYALVDMLQEWRRSQGFEYDVEEEDTTEADPLYYLQGYGIEALPEAETHEALQILETAREVGGDLEEDALQAAAKNSSAAVWNRGLQRALELDSRRVIRPFLTAVGDYEDAQELTDGLDDQTALRIMGTNALVDHALLEDRDWEDDFLLRAFSKVAQRTRTEVLRHLSEDGQLRFLGDGGDGSQLVEAWEENDQHPFEDLYDEKIPREWLKVEDNDVRAFMLSKMEDDEQAWETFGGKDEEGNVHSALAERVPYEKGLTLLHDEPSAASSYHDIQVLQALARNAPPDQVAFYVFFPGEGWAARNVRSKALQNPAILDPDVFPEVAQRIRAERPAEGHYDPEENERKTWLKHTLQAAVRKKRQEDIPGRSEAIRKSIAANPEEELDSRQAAIASLDDTDFLLSLFSLDKPFHYGVAPYLKGNRWGHGGNPVPIAAAKRLQELGYSLEPVHTQERGEDALYWRPDGVKWQDANGNLLAHIPSGPHRDAKGRLLDNQ